MIAPLTASKYELALRCIGAFVLPWTDSPNQHSEAGNERHAADEASITAGEIPEYLDARWPGYQWRAEVAFGLDVATGEAREVGQSIGRAYPEPRTPFERFGTADAIGLSEDHNHMVVVDKKGYEAVTAAGRNPQLRFLALAASRSFRPPAARRPPLRVTVAIASELHPLDVAELDAFELDTIPLELRRTEIAVAEARGAARAGSPPTFTTGRWCRWCPAFNACPEQRRLRSLVQRSDDDPELALVTTVIDDSDAPTVYALYKRIGILKKRIEETLYAMAARRPIPIGGGKMFGRHTVKGDREYDGSAVHAVVAAHPELGRDVADRVVEMTASQAQFERIVKPLVKRGKFAATARAVFGEVERQGKMQRVEKIEIGEFVPRLELVAPEHGPARLPAPQTPEVVAAPRPVDCSPAAYWRSPPPAPF